MYVGFDFWVFFFLLLIATSAAKIVWPERKSMSRIYVFFRCNNFPSCPVASCLVFSFISYLCRFHLFPKVDFFYVLCEFISLTFFLLFAYGSITYAHTTVCIVCALANDDAKKICVFIDFREQK